MIVLDQVFANGGVFIGTDPFTGESEIRYDVKNGNAFVQFDVDGDKSVDMLIKIVGYTNLIFDDFFT